MPTKQQNVSSRLSEHEAVCAERYSQINGRLKRIEIILIKSAGVMIFAMGAAIWTFISVK
jgi:hypothetical protein